MNKEMLPRNTNDYKLITTGIDLCHKVLSLIDCQPLLLENQHMKSIYDLVNKWNETFIKSYITKEVI